MTLVREIWSSWPARGLVVATAFKCLLWLSGPTVQNFTVVSLLDAVSTIVLIVSVGALVVPLVLQLQRRLLWRVRRRLVLSYIFIGLIPVLLVGVFFLLAGLLTLLSASSYLVKLSFDDLVDEASVAANGVMAELEAAGGQVAIDLDRHRRALAERHPEASLVLVSMPGDRLRPPGRAGPWAHTSPPEAWPSWASGNRFAGLVVAEPATGPRIVARAGYVNRSEGMRVGVVVDLPVGEATTIRILEQTGVELGGLSLDLGDVSAPPSALVETEVAPALPAAEPTLTPLQSVRGLSWFSFLEYTDWGDGATDFLYQETQVAPRALYQRVFGAQARIGEFSLGYAFLVALAVVGVLFLVIEFTALTMGLALARSITGSIHELFVGTEHVRGGDFGHRIVVQTQDQLGELAESFNAMTSSVKDLLLQSAEKKRLEEELRIAREIQMSLLPRDTTSIPGVSVTAMCVPAREVGGDYYDFIRLDDHRLGVLVADVSGKGTSAAFYMAELKGLILSLSQIYQSPKELLVEVNRIIAAHIDNRSFITMTYAVLDMEQGTLTHARAGHTPLIYVRGQAEASAAEILTPSGLVVGLEGFEAKFEALIEEQTLSVGRGDVAVLFTDGVSEAMNEEADLFGEDRLSRLVEENAALTTEALQERILADVDAFVGSADQHDDMTLVLLKVEEDVGAAVAATGT